MSWQDFPWAARKGSQVLQISFTGGEGLGLAEPPHLCSPCQCLKQNGVFKANQLVHCKAIEMGVTDFLIARCGFP